MQKPELNRRLTALDSMFLYTEHDSVPMHIGGIDTFEGEVDLGALRKDLSRRLRFIPRYRQRIVTPPFNLGHPTWEDDPDFDIANHVVELKLPKPGTDRQFQRQCSKLFEGMLDRDKPLWKVYLIQGLKGNRSGMLTLVHHCMVDGVSGAELLNILFDPTPNPKPVEAEEFKPEPLPPTRDVVVEAFWDNIGEQIQNWTELQKSLLRLARGIKGDMFMSLMRELPALSRDLAVPVRNFPFNTRKFTGRRKLAWSDVSFSEARAIRSEVGGTVNDVVLSTIGGAMRRYLGEHGYKYENRNLRVLIPVSLRSEDQRGTLGNQVSMLPIDIPLGEKDPIRRMQHITDRTSVLKTTHTAEWSYLLMHAWQALPPATQALLGGSAFEPRLQNLLQLALLTPGAHMVATNVPGPQIPLYTQGRRAERHVPLLPVVPGMGMNMGIFSYNHRLNFGLIADTGAAPDVDRFNAFLLESYAELRAAAGIVEAETIRMRHTPRTDTEAEPMPTTSGGGKKARVSSRANGATDGNGAPRKKPAKRVASKSKRKRTARPRKNSSSEND